MIANVRVACFYFVLFVTAVFAGDSFTVQEKSADHMRLSLQNQAIEFSQSDALQHLTIQGTGKTSEIGDPELPIFSTYIPVPENSEISVEYIIGTVQREEDVDLYRVQPEDIHPENSELPVSQSWSRTENIQYPPESFTLSEPLYMRGERLIRLDVIPFTYDDGEKTLDIHQDVEIEIRYTHSAQQPNVRLRSRAFEPFLMEMIPGYEPSSRDEDYQTPAILYICGGNALSNPYFQQLVSWRHKRGFKVYTASTAITGNSSGDIKSYITNAYNNFDPPPEYVGLIGDVNSSFDIPTYYENWSECYGGPCHGEGDYPYSLLEGDDLLPEVFLGRISVRSSQELAIVVAKTMNYEKVISPQDNWFEKAGLLVNPESYGSGGSLLSTNQFLEMILEMADYEDIDVGVEYDLYNASSWLNARLSDGVSYLNFRGLYGPGSFDIGVIMSNLDSQSMLPFVTFITCGTGSFAYELASPNEQFVRSGLSPSNYSGGVAAIGTATVGTHTQFNNLMDMGIYNGIFTQGVETAGAALAAGKMALINTYPGNPVHYVDIFCHWNNLIGDPGLHLWTDTPTVVTVQHPETILAESDIIHIEVTDENGAPVQDAVVTLLKGADEIFISRRTGEDGIASFDLDVGSTGEVNVTVSGRNLKPAMSSFDIVNSAYSLYAVLPVIVDDNSGGNGDGILNPGEDLTVSFYILNNGILGVNDVEAILHTYSDMVSINTPMFDIGGILAGNEQLASFEITLSSDCGYNFDPEFWIEISTGEGAEWAYALPLNVSAPDIQFQDILVIPGSVLEPGEEVQFIINLINSGDVSVDGFYGHLSYNGPQDVRVNEDDLDWQMLAPGESGGNFDTFWVQFGEEVIDGSLLKFDLALFNETGFEEFLEFEVQVGTASVDDPLGPDAFGHYIYDMGDVDYGYAPTYGWEEINPDKGGAGQQLYMYDCGNGVPDSQESELLELPFPVQFYGIEYDEITISTNGWIAFGNTGTYSFRNTPVPGPAGPSPMLAVFWDDLRNSPQGCSGARIGDVYYYYSEEDGYIIVEWSDLATYFMGDPVTFQAIIFDRSEDGDSDNEIKLQYSKFNNTSSGLYLPSYDGLIHGGHATIGLEDHLVIDGLQYTYDNEYPLTAGILDHESSLFITTGFPVNLFSADTTLGEPPLLVEFSTVDMDDVMSWAWDFDGDGIVDSYASDPDWEYTDYGHYEVTLTVTTANEEIVDRRRHYIHLVTYGCTDPVAYNYDELAAIDDGSCDYIYGCMDESAVNYDELAVYDDGSCFYIQYEAFTGDNVQNGDSFGRAIRYDGDFVIIGSHNDDVGGNMDQGSAYIFTMDEDGNWDQQDYLTAGDGAALDYYGYSVDVSGEYAIVGGYKCDTDMGINSGAAYVYHRVNSGVWIGEFKLTADDGDTNDNYGISVAIDGDYAVVGSYRDDNENGSNAGSVYAYIREGTGWIQIQKIVPSDGDEGDGFGSAVSLDNGNLVISSELRDTAGENSGSVYLYQLVDDEWMEVQEIIAFDADEYDHFGVSHSVYENTIVVGSYLDNNEYGTIAGSAYVFEIIGSQAVFQQKLLGIPDQDYYFGETVVVQGNYMAVGSSNRLFIYRKNVSGDWEQGAGFVTPANESVAIGGLYVLGGHSQNSVVHAYSLAEWEEWLGSMEANGDVNQDDVLDILDLVMLVQIILDILEPAGNELYVGDVNQDGDTNIQDIILMVEMIMS